MIKILVFLVLAGALFWFGKQFLDGAGKMTPADAARLLEVSPDADAETILAAHRRLIAKVHPDAGGSARLAAQVNEARDILIRRLSS